MLVFIKNAIAVLTITVGLPMSHSESRNAVAQTQHEAAERGVANPFGKQYHAFTQPLRTIEICASQSGRIDEVLVHRGDHVDAKTVLMRLDRRVLLAQREIAKQESQAVARLDALVVEQKLHEDRLQQVRELLSDGAGSREEVRRAEADAAVASLNVEAARENKQLAKLRLDEIDAKIAEREVRGSVDGWVIDVLKDSGEYVSMNSPHVITLVQLQQLRVKPRGP